MSTSVMYALFSSLNLNFPSAVPRGDLMSESSFFIVRHGNEPHQGGKLRKVGGKHSFNQHRLILAAKIKPQGCAVGPGVFTACRKVF